MADHITIPATGAGDATPKVATDQVNADEHYQRVKLSNGEADSAVHLGVFAEDEAFAGGDAGLMPLAVRTDTPANKSGTDGDFEPFQISAGGLWTRPLASIVTKTVSITRPANTTAYAVNDALSDSTTAPTVPTITGAARASGGSGYILDALAFSDNDPATRLQLELVIFDTTFTNINDNSAFAVSDAEILTQIGLISLALDDMGNNGGAYNGALNIPFTTVGSANLFFGVRVKNVYTPASGETITCRFKILQLD